jgi:hypothetical protein
MLDRCKAMMGSRGAAGSADRMDQHEQFMATQLDAFRASNKAPQAPLWRFERRAEEDRGPDVQGSDGHDVIDAR